MRLLQTMGTWLAQGYRAAYIKPQPLPPVIHPHSGGWRDGGVPHSRSHDGTPRAFPPHPKRQEAVRMASLAFSLPRSAPRHRDGPVMSANSPLRGRFFNRPLAASPPHPIRSSFTSKSTPPIKRMAWRSPKKRKPAPRRRWLSLRLSRKRCSCFSSSSHPSPVLRPAAWTTHRGLPAKAASHEKNLLNIFVRLADLNGNLSGRFFAVHSVSFFFSTDITSACLVNRKPPGPRQRHARGPGFFRAGQTPSFSWPFSASVPRRRKPARLPRA